MWPSCLNHLPNITKVTIEDLLVKTEDRGDESNSIRNLSRHSKVIKSFGGIMAGWDWKGDSGGVS